MKDFVRPKTGQEANDGDTRGAALGFLFFWGGAARYFCSLFVFFILHRDSFEPLS